MWLLDSVLSQLAAWLNGRASDFGSEDCGFESYRGRVFHFLFVSFLSRDVASERKEGMLVLFIWLPYFHISIFPKTYIYISWCRALLEKSHRTWLATFHYPAS